MKLFRRRLMTMDYFKPVQFSELQYITKWLDKCRPTPNRYAISPEDVDDILSAMKLCDQDFLKCAYFGERNDDWIAKVVAAKEFIIDALNVEDGKIPDIEDLALFITFKETTREEILTAIHKLHKAGNIGMLISNLPYLTAKELRNYIWAYYGIKTTPIRRSRFCYLPDDAEALYVTEVAD